MNKGMGTVYLVGAGCGEADLITLRGLRLLQSCDAVVYDDLIDGELLKAVPAHAERIYMGKREGRPSASQEAICGALLRLAKEGKTVVRLKGGDPFVFGRGGEEILALQREGVPFDEVPGISSAIAIPAMAGIPVTHRGLSRSVHIITARAAEGAGGLPAELEECAKLPGTLVILMGLSRLRFISQKLIAGGMSRTTPCAVLSGGNALRHAAVRGTLEDIAGKTEAAGVLPPAVIVVGSVAEMDLLPRMERPLDGIKIGITGTPVLADKLCQAFRELGARTVTLERLLVEELPLEIASVLPMAGERKLLVFTSANGVRVFFEKLGRSAFDLRGLASCAFAVIGSATGETLKRYGFRADISPKRFTTEELAKEIEKNWNGGEIILLRSTDGPAALRERLSRRFAVRDCFLYTVRPDSSPQRETAGLSYLTFCSAGGVKRFFRAWGTRKLEAVPVVIGAVTYAELRKYYSGRAVLSGACTVEEMVRATLEDAEKQRREGRE